MLYAALEMRRQGVTLEEVRQQYPSEAVAAVTELAATVPMLLVPTEAAIREFTTTTFRNCLMEYAQ